MGKHEYYTVGHHDMSKPVERRTLDPGYQSIVEPEGVSLFQVYRGVALGTYLAYSFPKAQLLMSNIGFEYRLDPRCITLSTTSWKEPALIRRAMEFLLLLAYNMPVELAYTLFTERLSSCVIDFDDLSRYLGINLAQRKKLFEDHRDELTLHTSCKIIIQAHCIVVIGKSKGVKEVWDAAIDCFFFNKSPALMIRRAERKLAWKQLRRRFQRISI